MYGLFGMNSTPYKFFSKFKPANLSPMARQSSCLSTIISLCIYVSTDHNFFISFNLPQFFFMSIKQSQSVPACISILFAPCLSVNLFMHIYWPQSVHICQSQFVPFCLSTYLFQCVYVRLSISNVPIYLSPFISTYLPTYFSLLIYIYWSQMFISINVGLFISVCLPTYFTLFMSI